MLVDLFSTVFLSFSLSQLHLHTSKTLIHSSINVVGFFFPFSVATFKFRTKTSDGRSLLQQWPLICFCAFQEKIEDSTFALHSVYISGKYDSSRGTQNLAWHTTCLLGQSNCRSSCCLHKLSTTPLSPSVGAGEKTGLNKLLYLNGGMK